MPLNEVESFSKSHPDTFFSTGIHPWEVHNADPSALDIFEKLLANDKFKAIGECGFDRNAKASFKEQGYFFERQVLLSEKYEKPVIIHCVASFNEIILLRKRYNPTQNWILHGFRGKPEMASQLLKHGFALSYGNKHNPASVEITPIDQLCIETDMHNDIQIETIYRAIATLKNCNIDELNAACRLLKLYVC